MNIQIIQNRLQEFGARNSIEELLALKQIFQEIILFSLSQSSFFSNAAFIGGTALRIIHGLQRFSEDLDFSITNPQKTFYWEKYLRQLQNDCSVFGFSVEAIDRSKADSVVKKAFLKDESFGKILTLNYQRLKSDSSIVKIRLEIDTNPPQGFITESRFCHFPIDYAVECFDLASLFAGKINAILTRKFHKGRDWFDLLWYIGKNISVNKTLLTQAVHQFDPSLASRLENEGIVTCLNEAIDRLDFTALVADVEPLLPSIFKSSLKMWDASYFKQRVAHIRASD